MVKSRTLQIGVLAGIIASVTTLAAVTFAARPILTVSATSGAIPYTVNEYKTDWITLPINNRMALFTPKVTSASHGGDVWITAGADQYSDTCTGIHDDAQLMDNAASSTYTFGAVGNICRQHILVAPVNAIMKVKR